MWRLVFTKRARKDILPLEKAVAKRIVARLDKALLNPKHFFSEIVGSPYHKLRAGDYRIIVVLLPAKKLIEVRRIGHRRNIYKRIR